MINAVQVFVLKCKRIESKYTGSIQLIYFYTEMYLSDSICFKSWHSFIYVLILLKLVVRGKDSNFHSHYGGKQFRAKNNDINF